MGETPKVVDLVGPKSKISEYIKLYKARLKWPKGSKPYRDAVAAGEILNNSQLAKKFKLGDVSNVERINTYLTKKEKLTYPEATDTSAKIRRAQLLETSLPKLEAEWSILKKGPSPFNPHLAHRQSKIFNVTTSTIGLDRPVINTYIVKPNETRIGSIYANRTKLMNKYSKRS